MKSLIVVPTYNENRNIEAFIRSVFRHAAAAELPFETHILVVDDNSPDGTADIVQTVQQVEFSDRLFLMVRDRKRGLGTAYIQGFRWGIQNGYAYLAEMDADFSHNPIYFFEMMRHRNHWDGMIGSRYVTGGAVTGWGAFRKIISKGGSIYARMILGVPIRDLTGGFNIWKRTVLEKVNLSRIRSEGYAFQIELKYRAYRKGFRLTEFPIVFYDRRQGQSKMSKKIILEAMARVWQLKLSDG